MNRCLKGKARNNLCSTSMTRHDFYMTSKTRYTYDVEHVIFKHGMAYGIEHINKFSICSKARLCMNWNLVRAHILNHGNKQVNMLAETSGHDTHVQSQVTHMNLKFYET
jgi:hypothetical protein